MHWNAYSMSGWGVWSYVFMTLVVLVPTALVLLAAAAVARRPGAERRGRSPDRSAEQVLAERFARGEIDDEEYRRRLAVLRGGPQPGSRGKT